MSRLITKLEIEQLVGTRVSNVSVYVQAFTHKSALKQYPELKNSYENLEFMGDSILGFIVTRYLYDLYSSEQEEGFLTKARTKIVRGTTLSSISERLELYRWVIMDEKGIKKGWNRNTKILEDVLEALIGAIYIDLGIIHTKQFIFRLLEQFPVDMNDDNYKDQLMRVCQNRRFELPLYTIDAQVNGVFYISAYVNSFLYGRGCGTTKKQAEQLAAKEAIKTMGLDISNAPASG